MRQFLLNECADGADLEGAEERLSQERWSFGSRHTFGKDEEFTEQERHSLGSSLSLGEGYLAEEAAPSPSRPGPLAPALRRYALESVQHEGVPSPSGSGPARRLAALSSLQGGLAGPVAAAAGPGRLPPSRLIAAGGEEMMPVFDESCASEGVVEHPSMPPLLASRVGLEHRV